MSMERKEILACPKCGHKQDFVIWQSLNGDIDPVAKQQLLDGELFNFKCEECGNVSNVDYPILYHDMTHEAMIYYVDDNSVEQAYQAMVGAENKIGIEMSGYRRRIVTKQNSLREKAIIFDYGLDDRVIEIIKLIYHTNANDQVSDVKIDDVYFLVSDDKYLLAFIGDKPLSVEVPVSLYDDIKKDFSERFNLMGDKEPIIDYSWALKLFSN